MCPRRKMFHVEHKYGAKKITHHSGRSFASKLESALYDYLLFLEKAGEIAGLACQPHVFLTDARIEMIPDFAATKDGAIIYFEAKGFETDTWRLKRRLWKVYGPGRLQVFKGTASKLTMVEEIIPSGEKCQPG